MIIRSAQTVIHEQNLEQWCRGHWKRVMEKILSEILINCGSSWGQHIQGLRQNWEVTCAASESYEIGFLWRSGDVIVGTNILITAWNSWVLFRPLQKDRYFPGHCPRGAVVRYLDPGSSSDAKAAGISASYCLTSLLSSSVSVPLPSRLTLLGFRVAVFDTSCGCGVLKWILLSFTLPTWLHR